MRLEFKKNKRADLFKTYQGSMRPKRVQGLRDTRKPTVGSVMPSQARPTNRMMEA